MITDTTPPRTLAPVQNGHNVGIILDALKAMLDLHELGLVTCVYPEGSRAYRQVEQGTQQARLVLAGTRKYGHLYRKEDD